MKKINNILSIALILSVFFAPPPPVNRLCLWARNMAKLETRTDTALKWGGTKYIQVEVAPKPSMLWVKLIGKYCK